MRLHEEGLLPAPLCFQFVLGVGGVPASISQVEHMRSLIPDDARWSVCALGPRQLPLNLYCLAEGGHVRTGLEDNIYFRKGELATNVQLVERIGRIAAELGRPVATPAEARRIFEIETAAPPEASST
jgi:3-keto-5-aminohexanoate cleavage enzyme